MLFNPEPTEDRHVHSFVFYKKTKSGMQYFKCNDPDCTTFFDKAMLVGKSSLCPICKQTVFVLTKEALKRRQPRCLSCSDTKEAAQFKRAKSIASALFKEEDQKSA